MTEILKIILPLKLGHFFGTSACVAQSVDFSPALSLYEFSTAVVIHKIKGFSIVNEAEIDDFLKFLFFFFFPVIQWMLAI